MAVWNLLAVLALFTTWPALSLADDYNCPYGNETLEHGEIATVVAECCMQLVCCNGTITKTYVDYEHPTRHLDENPCHHVHDHEERHHHDDHDGNNHTHGHDRRRCCEWKGNIYPEEYLMMANESCMQMECHQGHWDFTGLIYEECGHCSVYNDPHVITHDSYSYDWHGKCNYSLSQEGSSYDPEFGVFSDFAGCFKRKTNMEFPSCLNQTTYRDNPHTIIDMDTKNIFRVYINGHKMTIDDNHGASQLLTPDTYHPVLGFRLEYFKGMKCAVLVGSSGLVVMNCGYRLDIWAGPQLMYTLGGLCGNYSEDTDDDFTLRNGTVDDPEYNPEDFPLSWKTTDQSAPCNSSCPEPSNAQCPDGRILVDTPCMDTKENKRKYGAECAKRIKNDVYNYEALRRSCEYDLCALGEYYPKPNKPRKRWLRSVIKPNYKLSMKIQMMMDMEDEV